MKYYNTNRYQYHRITYALDGVEHTETIIRKANLGQPTLLGAARILARELNVGKPYHRRAKDYEVTKIESAGFNF